MADQPRKLFWTKLDNAALIFPASLRRNWSNSFRIAFSFCDPVDPAVLQQALDRTVVRFPSVNVRLRSSLFWYYLEELPQAPVVREDSYQPLVRMTRGDIRRCAFRVLYYRNRMAVEYFHSVTDGTGGLVFAKNLTAEYVRLRYGQDVPSGKWVLDLGEEASEAEMEDSFDSFSGTKGSLDKEEKAYHLDGTEEVPGVLHDIRVSLPLDKVAVLARNCSCTLTEFITAVMLLSLQQVRSNKPRRGDSPFIKVEVPVNLRPIFQSRTLRNFSSYVHLGIDVRNGDLPFRDILQEVKLQKHLFVNPHRLTTRVAANVALEDNLAIRSIPLFIKKAAINFINSHKGENYCSHTLSNLGEISLPQEMRFHVRDIDFILGRTQKKSGSCACVSYNGRLNLHFSRKIVEHGFENAFVHNLRLMGIDAQTEHSTPSEKTRDMSRTPSIPMRWAKVGMLRTLLLI